MEYCDRAFEAERELTQKARGVWEETIWCGEKLVELVQVIHFGGTVGGTVMSMHSDRPLGFFSVERRP
jgi:hypothetical protein